MDKVDVQWLNMRVGKKNYAMVSRKGLMMREGQSFLYKIFGVDPPIAGLAEQVYNAGVLDTTYRVRFDEFRDSCIFRVTCNAPIQGTRQKSVETILRIFAKVTDLDALTIRRVKGSDTEVQGELL